MKISVIGSSGKVASQFMQQIFTKNKREDLDFTFVSQHPDLVSSRIMDIVSVDAFNGSRGYRDPNYEIADTTENIAGSDMVVVCAGQLMDATEKEKLRDIDPTGRLAHTIASYDMVRKISFDIARLCPNATVVVVTNQSDLCADVIRKVLDPDLVYGFGGMLDEARFRRVIAVEANRLPDYLGRVDPREVEVDMVGFHNNYMIPIVGSLSVPDFSRFQLEEIGLVKVALEQTRTYGRDVSRNKDPRHPTVHSGASIGPGAAIWETVAAWSGQRALLRTSYNTRIGDEYASSYDLDSGTTMSVPVTFSEGSVDVCRTIVPPNALEKAQIHDFVGSMRDSLSTLEKIHIERSFVR